MHLIGWLPEGSDDAEVSRRAAAAGITAPAVSSYVLRHAVKPGLILGYAALNPRQIREGARKLACAMLDKSLVY